jgi:hypothetical protein
VLILKGLRLAGGAVLMAVAIWLMLSTPGFLSDRDSTEPVQAGQEAVR